MCCYIYRAKILIAHIPPPFLFVIDMLVLMHSPSPVRMFLKSWPTNKEEIFMIQGDKNPWGLPPLELRYGTKHALILEDEILQPRGELNLSVRVVGEKPSLRWLHCYVKFEWDMRSHFMVSTYKELTFVITFMSAPDYLRVVDRVWGFIDDKVLRVSRDPPEMLHT